jgi:branched-chain amino acid transport system ATP-binding protein
LSPRGGAVELFGAPITRLPPEDISARGVGLVPQGRRIFRSLTVRENLTVAQHARRDGKSLWTLDTVFKLFPRLNERRNQMAGYLSGGEQQMLAIGRALMGNPRVLLMDEPSEGLAPQLVAEVGRTIAALKSEGQSILLADDVVIINTGQVVFRGTAGEAAAAHETIALHLGVF